MDVVRIKPTENSFIAFTKSLIPSNDKVPYINYSYVSKLLKQYHLPDGINEYIIDLPFNQSIPEIIYFCMLSYDSYNTTDYKSNGLYLEHFFFLKFI